MTEQQIQDFLESLWANPTCDWCKHPEKAVYRIGLCSHCYRISRQVSKFESDIDSLKKKRQSIPSEVELWYRVAKQKEKLAKGEGDIYGNIHGKHVDGLLLENAFSALAQRLLNQKGLFLGDAGFLSNAFPNQGQRRLIFYLLSKFLREWDRKFRHQTATKRVVYKYRG